MYTKGRFIFVHKAQGFMNDTFGAFTATLKNTAVFSGRDC
jgi:hypothetical protein